MATPNKKIIQFFDICSRYKHRNLRRKGGKREIIFVLQEHIKCIQFFAYQKLVTPSLHGVTKPLP